MPPNADPRAAPGTMFPSLSDGGTPGDRDGGTDITGDILPDMTPKADLAPGTGSSLSIAPDAPDAPAAAGKPVSAGTIPAPADRRPRTAQERIAQLTRRYRQAQDQNNDLGAQIQELLAISRAQANELAAWKSGRPQRAPELDADPTGGAAGSQAGSITLDAVRNVIREEVSGYDRLRRESDLRIEQMKAAHMASFKEAAAEMPELLDQRSQARQVFDELYGSSPLTQFQDGPYQIALQVRGILAGDARRSQETEARKLQASVLSPSAPSVDIASSEISAAQKEFADLSKVRQAGNEDFRVYKRWRTLRDFLHANGVKV